MAAGMGSRFGGLKQAAKFGTPPKTMLDFSIGDAMEAGFEKIVFVIRKDIESAFRESVSAKYEKLADVRYVFQEACGAKLPEGRTKPWGTGHAVLSCIDILDGPFAVINADDYYGPEAFKMIYDYLTTHEDDSRYRYTMVGYRLGNTLTENGHVSRGVCTVDSKGYLTGICERSFFVMSPDGAAYSEDDGQTLIPISPDERVSMNMWGFSASILKELNERFAAFLAKNLETNPLKCEYFLPFVVDELLREGKATVQVRKSMDKWYGVTYKEDKPNVVAAIRKVKAQGLYPERLWEEA